MRGYRKIYEEHYKIKIPKGYHVHHKDMNHANDDPLNLEALSPDEHARKHGFRSNFIMAQARATDLAARRNRGQSLSEAHKKKISIRMLGKKKSVEHNERVSASMIGNTNCTGKKNALGYHHSAETKVRIAATIRAQRATCPHCKKIGGTNGMTRWHFDNCKEVI